MESKLQNGTKVRMKSTAWLRARGNSELFSSRYGGLEGTVSFFDRCYRFIPRYNNEASIFALPQDFDPIEDSCTLEDIFCGI